MVKIGKISVVQKEEEEETLDMLSLPTGGQVAVSCHLSAGCVTLKDVDVNTRVDSLDIKLSSLLNFVKSLKQTTVEEDEDTRKQQESVQMYQKQSNTSSSGEKIIQLLRSVTFTVDNTTMEAQHQRGCHSSLSLQDIYISGLAETCVPGVDPYYKFQCTLGLTSWTLFDGAEEMKLITVPEIRSSANVAQSLVISKRIHDDLSILDDDNLSSSNLKPNQKFANVTLIVREPKLNLDITKVDILSKLKSQNSIKKSQVHEKGTTNATYFNIPRASLSLTLESPSVFFSLKKHAGVVSWSSIAMDVSGIYSAQKNRPVSIVSRFSEPLKSFKDDSTEFHADSTAVQRVQSQTRPSWTNLFRRSWKAKANEAGEKNLTQWVYKATIRLTIQNTGLDHAKDLTDPRPTLNPKKRHDVDEEPNTFISVKNFECDIQTKLDVSFVENVSGQDVVSVWDPSSHQVNVDVAIDKPVLNLWTRTHDGVSQMEFWVVDVINNIKSSFKSQKVSESLSEEISQPRDRTDLFSYISVCKVNFMVTDVAVVLDGVDKGLRGTRQVPKGYLDNAPEKDVDVRVVMSIQQIAYVFNGSRIFSSVRGKHQYSLSVGSISTDDTDDETIAANENVKTQQVTFGTSRLSIQHIVIERIFKTEDYLEETGWHHHEDRKVFILWISRINARTEMLLEAGRQIVVTPSIVIKKNGFQYTVSNHYACLVTAMSTSSMMKRCFLKNENVSASRGTSSLAVRTLQLQINRSDFHIFLPGEETQLYLRMDSLRTQWNNTLDNHGEVPSTAIRNITLYGVAPRYPDQWDQLLELDNIKFSIEKDVDFTNGTLTKTNQLYMSKLYIRIPCGYQLSNFVDGTVTLIKGIKAMHARILKGMSFLYFGPNEKKDPVLMPNVRVECDLLTLQFEDDPFEARLRSIWKTGLLEQSNRIAIQDAFEAKARSLKESGNENDFNFSQEETDARVNEAWQGLQEHNSKSWIRHINSALSKENSLYEKIQSEYYRNTVVAGQLDENVDDSMDEKTQYISEIFSIKIVDLPLYPALLDFTMKNTSLVFRLPDFSLDKTREFIFDVGKGQPLDTPLSTLIPFHLDWKTGETWAQIRDYPIPFMLVPPVNDDSENSCTWSLSGNYVFADDLGTLDGTRKIEVPVINENGISYLMNIARTSTPLKFFSTVNIDVHNTGLSHICWCVPYQPAIQDISRVLDTFTKPPVDPSEKVGFWDKVRLLIHTRVKIKFVGGGDLAIVIKGSRNPYDMSEKSFGLAKVWRNDVIWLLGEKNEQNEFMQIISQDYAFGVPDLVHGGYTASYIPAADNSGRNVNNSQPLHKSTSLSSFNASSLKDNHNESRFVKIALKLTDGIRMGLGCHLERMCKSNCEICSEDSDVSAEIREEHKSKLLEFLPHYKVKMKAPQNVHEKDYDAYIGFRSDYIHFSISIVKTSDYVQESDKGNVTGNSMHLTPGFIDHFVSWFRLFGGAMSYPLRAGSLFPKDDTRPTKKFGRHMSTMKYKVVVNPLTVGYFLKDENVVPEFITTEELGASMGMKGFVQGFCVDIHQRREVVNVANYKLDQKRLKANWPMSEAEVQIKNIDLRVVKAEYISSNDDTLSSSGTENVSVPVTNDSSYPSDQSDDGLDMLEGLNYQCNNDSDSSDWVDLDDFIELDVVTPNILPNVQVLPFAFTPCIYYLRRSNRDDMQKYKYLHKTHDCILGTAVDTREMQINLLRDRSNSIDVQIRKHQARLHSIELKRLQHTPDEKNLEEMSDTIVEKTRILYEKRELLQRYLKQLSNGQKSDTYAKSTIFGEDSLALWEELMGPFKVRYIAHNPQILWNNSVRNILYHGMDLRDQRRALSYYLTSRTVKFLRDLIEAADLHYGDFSKPFVLDDNEGGMDSNMAEELIAKLLSEKETSFYAPNETEEEGQQDDSDSGDVDMSRSDNVNNPRMQLKTIPKQFVMKSSYLVDLLNPQISLQSDCDPNNIVLVANERTQVKGLNIIDENDPDVEMEMVKHRTVVSLDNVQFFVAKKEKFDSVDLLLDNHYGAKESDHWLTWIPPEMLINYVKRSDQFQRIGDRIAATMLYDKYNPLRIKANANLYSQAHPFEDRCDSVQLNFPKLKMIADSAQYNAVYQVATDLLLYKEPAKKERLARLREIMMAADRASLFEATERIVDLQNRARQLIHARHQYRQNMALLDDRRIEEFKTIRLALNDTLEELYLGMEAIKLMQSNQRKDYHEPKTNLKFTLCAEKLVWEMLAKGETPLSEWTLTNFNFVFVSKEDHSSTNTLEVDILHVKNTSPSPVFVDVLGPYYNSRKPYDFSRHKMLRCYFVSLPPVGGIPVIQHLETNLHPLRVQMTYSFGKALGHYLFPPEKRQKQLESTAMTASTSTPTASNMPALTENEGDLSSSAVIVPNQSSSEKTDREGVKSFGAMKAFESTPVLPLTADSQRLSVNSNPTHSVPASVREDMESDFFDDSPSASVVLPTTSSSKKSRKDQVQKLAKLKTPDDLSVMKKRASSNRAFILVKIPGARHCLSYQGPKDKNIEDLRDFAFEQPTLEFRNETWSWYELISNIKKDFMRAALLHNSTALLKEKLLRRHPRDNSKSIEGSPSLHSAPAHSIPTTSAPTYTTDHQMNSSAFSQNEINRNSNVTDSSREDEPEEEDKDIISLNSVNSHEIWEADNSEAAPKKSHIWSKFVKPKKSSSTATDRNAKPLPEVVLQVNGGDNHLSINDAHDYHRRNSSSGGSPIVLQRSISAATRHLQDDDQLAVKGRYLLGKYYNGPTQWLAPGSKSKGKQTSKK